MATGNISSTRLVQVSYDRSIFCDPFHDDTRGLVIAGIAVFVRFDQVFTVDVEQDGEPVGAAELNRQLSIDYTPEAGFHAVDDPGGWSFHEYMLLVEKHPGWFEELQITEDAFHEFRRLHAHRFHAERSLQSAAYALHEITPAADQALARPASMTSASPNPTQPNERHVR